MTTEGALLLKKWLSFVLVSILLGVVDSFGWIPQSIREGPLFLMILW